MENTRQVYRLNNEKEYWYKINFSDIKKGDEIMLYEADGKPVIGNKNEQVFIVSKDAYINTDGIWTFEYQE